MSVLKVANIHFETTGTNRLEYDANNNINFRTGGGNFTVSVGGSEVLNVNTSSAIVGGINVAAQTTRNVSAGGIATGGGDLSADRTITVTKATGAEVTTGTDDTHAVTPKALADAGINIPRTGTVRLTLQTTAESGWVLMDDGTIGNGSSGGTTRANADTVDLFTLLWNNTDNADCAVSTGRGANAAADYAAGKTIALPKAKGRAFGVYGTGSGLTARALAKSVGEETHTPTLAEMYAHTHTILGGSAIMFTTTGPNGPTTGGYGFTGGGTTDIRGSSTAFNVMSPTTFINAEIKL